MSLPRYPKYKDSGIEWLGEVPDNWKLTPLKHVASLKGRLGWQGLRAEEYTEEGPFLVTSEHLENDRVAWHRCHHVSEERYSIAPEIQLRPHDVLMMKDGAAMGKLAYVDSLPAPACLNSHLLVFRSATGHFVNRFLYYCLRSPAFETFMVLERKGSTFFGLSQESIGNFPFLLPPMAEQLGVVAFLDQETAKIDALIAEQRRLMELLKEKRQAVISHAVTKGLNPDAPMKPSGIEWLGWTPSHWQMKRLKHITIESSGIQMGPFGGMILELAGEDTGYKVYGQENTTNADLLLGRRWIEKSRFDALQNYHLAVGDILLTRKGTLGNAYLIESLPQPGIMDSDTIRVRVNDTWMIPEFLALLLHESSHIAEQITLSKRGAILPGLNTETVSNITVAVPPVAEQFALLQFLGAERAKFDTLTAEAQRAIDLLQERRTALISAAVTGQIDVRNLV